MSTIDIIVLLLKQKGKTQKELTDFLGVSKNTFTDWKSGRIKSYNKYLPQIAEFFDVSVDYLTGRTEKAAQDGPPLSEKKRKAIELIYNAPDDELAALIPFLEKMFPEKSE